MTSVRDVVRVFLDAVQQLLDEGARAGDFSLRSGYSVTVESWERMRDRLTAYDLAVGEATQWRGKPEVYLEGPMSGFVEAFRAASARLVELLAQVPRRSPTYGIFAPADSESTDRALHRWAAQHGIAQAVSLAGVDRVLFCLGARDRFEQTLQAASGDVVETRRLAAQFQRCVLVHEHFHAITEVGLSADLDPGPATGLSADRSKALRLNEALAA